LVHVILGAVVLAAGQGTRMKSALPKVLHPLAGRPMIGWVLASLAGTDVTETVVVVGHGADAVAAALPEGATTCVQDEQFGTGHATGIGLAALPRACDTVLVVCGDTPLLSNELVVALVAQHAATRPSATMVTTVLPDAGAYGRVVRDGGGRVMGVVEARDASDAEAQIAEINAGIFMFDRAALTAALSQVGSGNAQSEIYLPDVLPILGGAVETLITDDSDVVLGVNTRVDLAACEAILQARLREALMLDGVSIPDPTSVYLGADVLVGPDTVLLPGVYLRGATTVGANCVIGPNCVIDDATIADGAQVINAVVRESDIGPGTSIGPFAYVRPGTRLLAKAKIGTFVETKNAVIGARSKVPHLSYIGDAEIGEDTNIGAGNITANYDGFRKHRTTVGARVKTGSDCVLVAPVTIGDDAMTGAGSIITDEVPAGALGIARARQRVIEDFTRRAAAKARAASEDSGGHQA
jgi:bifunctional UDP-N-acetylglucosamine pyrophosphorylase/glucosamine-1-phosphate N-acetyltransferase